MTENKKDAINQLHLLLKDHLIDKLISDIYNELDYEFKKEMYKPNKFK